MGGVLIRRPADVRVATGKPIPLTPLPGVWHFPRANFMRHNCEKRDITLLNADRPFSRLSWIRSPRLLLAIPGFFALTLALAAALLSLTPADFALAQDDTSRPEINARPVLLSNPASGDTYRLGEMIIIGLTFSESVTVTGQPRLRIAVGDQVRWAIYNSAAREGTFLRFTYTVKDNDADADGISIGKNQLKLNGGSIADADGNAAGLNHRRLADQAGHKVDGFAGPEITHRPKLLSSPVSGDTYRRGETIVVGLTFSEPLTVTGKPRLHIAVGDRVRWARYDSAGREGTRLSFAYTVKGNDADADGISIGKSQLKLNGGSIADADGNAARLKHKRLPDQVGHKVNGSQDEPPPEPTPAPPTNRQPQFADETVARSIAENAPAGQNVGPPITAEDADGDTLTYALTGADAASFDFNVATGQLTVKDALDYETRSGYSVTVTVTDSKNAAGEADDTVDDTIAVTVSVSNVDEPGVVSLGMASAAPEVGSAVKAALLDPDGGVSALSWSWARSADGTTWTDIDGAIAGSYTPTEDDVGHYLRAVASYTDPESPGKTAQNTTANTVALPPIGGTSEFYGSSQGTTTTVTCANTVATPSGSSAGLVADCEALLAAKESLSGTGTLNWATTLAIGSWAGITVEDGRVTRLGSDSLLGRAFLESEVDGGSIPTQLGSLSELTYLNLRASELTGSIPTSLGGLTKLKHLHLDTNELDGALPSQLGNLTNLATLNLSNNELTGALPSQLGNLTNLEDLNLSKNQLSGALPSQLGNLTNLEYLTLSENQLSGALPYQLGNLTNLKQLDLSKNQLSGALPDSSTQQKLGISLGNLTNLATLDLSHNQLSGVLSGRLGILANLEFLNLSNNELSGPLPPHYGNLSKLRVLYLDDNDLTGPIPAEYAKLTSVWEAFGLHLHGNSLTGTVTLTPSPVRLSESGGARNITVTATLDPGSAWANQRFVSNPSGSLVTVAVNGLSGDVVDVDHSDQFEITIPWGNKRGSVSTTFTVTPTADTDDEADEILTFTATGDGARGSVNLTLTSATPPATVTISDDVDTVGPTIVGSPAITSDPGLVKTYKIGDNITATVTFNELITVSGTPKLTIKVGSVDKVANCVAGSAGTSLVCTYTVAANDADLDGVEIQANKLTLPTGASIKDGADNDANPAHPALGAQEGHKVDTSPPAKPNGLVATPGDTVVVLSWNDPQDPTIVEYEYQFKGDDYWYLMIPSSSDTTTHVLHDMENDTSYEIRIRAVDAVHEGPASQIVEATPVKTFKPRKPIDLSALGGDGKVTLIWSLSDLEYIVPTITKYQLKIGTRPWTDIPNSGGLLEQHTIDSLTNGTEYAFRLRAVNKAGTGPSAKVKATPTAGVPAKPAGLAVTPVVGNMRLSWTDPNDASNPRYERLVSGGGHAGEWEEMYADEIVKDDDGKLWFDQPWGPFVTDEYEICEPPPSDAGCQDHPPVPGVPLTYKIRAWNANGMSPESDAVIATPITGEGSPAKPTGVTVTAGNGQATLSWTNPNDSKIDGYLFRIGMAPITPMPGSNSATVSHTFTGLENDTTYGFVIAAYRGESLASQFSDAVTVTPTAISE